MHSPKIFLDTPAEKAKTKDCDTILARCGDIDSRIELLVIDLTSKADGNANKIKALQDRSQTTTDLQVKDRITTIINSLTTERETAVRDNKTWVARRSELLSQKKKIEEYRRVLEILETK